MLQYKVAWPSGKAEICKISIREFDSRRDLILDNTCLSAKHTMWRSHRAISIGIWKRLLITRKERVYSLSCFFSFVNRYIDKGDRVDGETIFERFLYLDTLTLEEVEC